MSQTARILGVLQDGQPHLVSEIHELSGYSRLNSRISDLRARGYVIECFHVPNRTGSEGYGYTLISEPQNCSDDTDPPRVTAGARVAADPSSATSEQLSLVDVWRDVLAPRDANVVYLHDPDRDNYSRKVPA